MADPNAASTARATMATLDARVQGLDRDYQDLKRTLLDLDSKIDQSIASIGNRFENSLSVLTNKIEAKSTTQWPVIFGGMSVLLTIITVIGTMAYLPIQRDTGRLDAAVSAILDRGVFQREYGADQVRLQENLRAFRTDMGTHINGPRYGADQERINHALDELRSRFAPKSEMEATFRERQKQIETNSTNIDLLRVRTYDHVGRIMKVEQSTTDIDKRLDAISARLAQHIRDGERRPTP